MRAAQIAMKLLRTWILFLSVSASACATPVGSQSSTHEIFELCDGAALIEGIDALDETAISTALRSAQCFDGHELEDIYRALGVAFSREPELVTRKILDAGVRANIIAEIMTMLPLSFVDDPCGSADELELRQALMLKAGMPPDIERVLSSEVRQSLERDRRECLAESDARIH